MNHMRIWARQFVIDLMVSATGRGIPAGARTLGHIKSE